MTETRKIRILIADDFKLLRDVIRLYLERAGNMQAVDEAPDLDEALEHALSMQPDVVIMNDYLPPLDSAHAAALFRQRGIHAPILVISLHPDANLIERSLNNGVNGFMDKDEIAEHLEPAIRTVLRGERYLSPRAQEARGSEKE